MASEGKKRKKTFLGRHLMLKKEYADKLLSGLKRATIRLGIVHVKYPELIVHAGGRPVAKVRVTGRVVKRVKDLTDEDARLDGFRDKEELIRELERVYGRVHPGDYVTIIGLEVVKRFDETVSENPYGGLSPGDLARIALRYIGDHFSEEEKEILLDLTRTNSIRLSAIRLYGGIHKRKRIRRVLRKALYLLQREGILS